MYTSNCDLVKALSHEKTFIQTFETLTSNLKLSANLWLNFCYSGLGRLNDLTLSCMSTESRMDFVHEHHVWDFPVIFCGL